MTDYILWNMQIRSFGKKTAEKINKKLVRIIWRAFCIYPIFVYPIFYSSSNNTEVTDFSQPPLCNSMKNVIHYNPLALKIFSLASLISWNFFSAALRTSSPRAATLSG